MGPGPELRGNRLSRRGRQAAEEARSPAGEIAHVDHEGVSVSQQRGAEVVVSQRARALPVFVRALPRRTPALTPEETAQPLALPVVRAAIPRAKSRQLLGRPSCPRPRAAAPTYHKVGGPHLEGATTDPGRDARGF